MPKKFMQIKKKEMAKGKSENVAAEIAAKVYNSQRKPGQRPVTKNYHR